MKSVKIFDLKIAKASLPETVKKIEGFVEKRGRHQVVTINPEYVVLAQDDYQLKEAIANCSLIVADGVGIILASWLVYLKKYVFNVILASFSVIPDLIRNLYNKFIYIDSRLRGNDRRTLGRMKKRRKEASLPPVLSFKERIVGSELVEALAKLVAEKGWRIGLVGGELGVARKALNQLKTRYEIRDTKLGGFVSSGSPNVQKETKEEQREVRQLILKERPQILLTSFGFYGPIWINKTLEYLRRRGVAVVAIEVGGVFNYLSGRSRRPPELMRKIGLEWLWRLAAEPWRWRRQLRLLKFVGMVLKSSD